MSMTKEFNAAIIGAGAMGGNHAACWKERADARVAAVYDPDGARCQALAASCGAVACTTPEAAFAVAGVNVASICTPVCHHRPMAELAFRANCHVLCEKPIALTDEDARAMISAARFADRHLAVSYQYRTFPAWQQARELVQSGAIGTPICARFVDVREVRPKLAMHSRSMNGGPIIDMAGHFFDLMRFITGTEPLKVMASGHVYGEGKARLASIRDFAIDNAEIQVQYGDGHVLSAYVNWGMPEGHPGYVQNTITGPQGVIHGLPGELRLDLTDRTISHRLPKAGFGPAGRIADLVGAIRGEHALEVDGEVGRRALGVSLAVLRSIASGQMVELPRV